MNTQETAIKYGVPMPETCKELGWKTQTIFAWIKKECEWILINYNDWKHFDFPNYINAPQMHEIIQNVELWAYERGLITNGNELAQCVKTTEELGELASAILKKDTEKIIDAIGDVTVCLIVISKQLGFEFSECLAFAYNEIKDRKGKTENGTFIKE